MGAKDAVAAVNSKVARRMAIVAPFGVLARDFIFSRDWGLGWAGVRPSEGCYRASYRVGLPKWVGFIPVV